MMRYFSRSASEPIDEYDLAMIAMRIVATIVFGGLLVMGWRLLSHDRRLRVPLGRRVLLNVEDAVRWRPEF